ncbi:nitroreductase family deazaflavin-dependent oxidoreductase [Nocardia mexicana]|nr:nitroreductase family deazaflavin-dependent oxidoreductase [Nocardia mexicana]
MPSRPRFFDSRFYAPVMRVFTQGHVALFRVTGGRVGGKFRFGSGFPRGVPVALLTTRGRKTGKARTMALLYMADGDRVVFVASRGGTPRHPQWFHNIKADPKVRVHTRGGVRAMIAHEAEGDERADLWRRVVEYYPEWGSYQTWTDRRIPLIVCEPA